MPYIPMVFFILGIILSLVGNIWGLVQAFQEQYSSSESSPQLSPSPICEHTSGNISGQQENFKQLMKLGYIYYGQGDYQTALINFNRALQVRPSDIYAVKAVRNTKNAIVQAKSK